MHYGTEMNASQFGVKGQGHIGITCWNRHCTGGGIQYLMSRVELDFLAV